MMTWVPEEDWIVNTDEGKDAVQIIGWLYQYYNSEKKDEVFAALKKNVKITKENIPAATQLFTPDWIVRYMVENSLGRLWVEGHPDDGLKSQWKYYLDEAEQEPAVQTQLAAIRKVYASITPEQIQCIDPCAGSGHILAYMFDVLVQIYEAYGYTAREAVRSIIENNIYGLDIDDRAAQLAYFAVMMKARQYDRRFLSRKDADGNPDVPQPHVYAIVESNGIDAYALDYFVNGNPKLKMSMDSIIKEMHNAKEYGSILNITSVDFAALYARFDEVRDDISMSRETVLNDFLPLVQVAEAMTKKYDVAATNPPYMGMAGMSTHLSDFVKKEYPRSKSDLFAVFIEKCSNMTKTNGFYSLITMQSWMFLSSYEDLRESVLRKDAIQSLLHLGIKAFEEIGNDIVQTASFVTRKNVMPSYSGSYFRLLTHNREEKVSDFLARRNMYTFKQELFAGIPGSPIAYWVGPNTLSAFVNMKCLGDVSEPKQGIATADNNKFLRLWYEVALDDIAFGIGDGASAIECGKTWFPYQKGGDFRKWYGNNNYVVLWKNNGQTIKSFEAAVVRNPEYHLREGLSWTWITTGYFGARFSPQGSVFDVAGSTLFASNHLYEILGYMCSSVADYLVKIINPTINFSNGVISKLPVTLDLPSRVDELVRENIVISQTDWDAFETSWDFRCHPLIDMIYKGGARFERGNIYLSECYQLWESECSERFNQLKSNEEELNRIFIDIYRFQSEVSPEVEDKDVTQTSHP